MFAALVLATVAAFFVTQHLKVSTPLIAGFPAPDPAFLNPSGARCQGKDHTKMHVSFYLLHRADDVDVYVVDESGQIIATLATGRHMRRAVRTPDGEFFWNGREDNGSLAPDGEYFIRVALLGQGRTVQLTKKPVTVQTLPPRPVVRSVSPGLIPQGSSPVTIRYAGNQRRPGTVQIYRTDLPGRPRVQTSFPIVPTQPARWDGTIGGRPAPAGVYLVGLSVTDLACNTGRFPAELPPAPGTTDHAGVTVRYLAAEPPLHPVAAGSRATVYVDARRRGYRWTLWRVGVRKPELSGEGRAGSYVIHVKLPAKPGPGLYKLSLRAGPYRTEVPLVARAAGGRRKVLVVLPALTWQGENPSDDNGDGVPNTLDNGGPVKLQRPFEKGLPPGFGDEQALLIYLDKTHLSYDLTTDVDLIDGSSRFSGHNAVVLAGSERWVPGSLGTGLRSYVQQGGHVLSLGIDSLRRTVTLAAGQAVHPSAASANDALGAKPGPLTTGNTGLILVSHDGLGIFTSTSGAFSGFSSQQPFPAVLPPERIESAAGTSSRSPSIIGYRLGKGIVVNIGLVGFGSSLVHNVDARELVSRLWTVLGR
jgi:hypothetical protein